MLALVITAVFPALVIYAAVSDARTYLIPNWISLALFAAFLVTAPFALGWSAMGMHLIVGLAVFAVGVGLFALGWVGGGDAKLITAVAVWVGWPVFAEFLIWTALAGGVLSLSILVVRRLPVMAGVGARVGWVAQLLSPERGVPYGVAIAAGALAVYVKTPAFLALAG